MLGLVSAQHEAEPIKHANNTNERARFINFIRSTERSVQRKALGVGALATLGADACGFPLNDSSRHRGSERPISEIDHAEYLS